MARRSDLLLVRLPVLPVVLLVLQAREECLALGHDCSGRQSAPDTGVLDPLV
jgi:hypothetical protein